MKHRKSPSNLPASVRQRLFNIAKQKNQVFDLILTRYALERLLYRLSQSAYQDRFILKGAMLFVLWTGESHRPTRDLDLLGYGDSSQDGLLTCFRELCNMDVEPDGLLFEADSISIDSIREDQVYQGQRVQMTAYLAQARILLQIDIGFGDVVTQSLSNIEYPTLLDFNAPHLRVYPREVVIAEKLHAMVVLGMANSRMKDYYDIVTLAQLFDFDGPTLAQAIQQTFQQRQTPIPTEIPVALTVEFGEHPNKMQQWQGFLRKGIRESYQLADIVVEIRDFVWPILEAIVQDKHFEGRWLADDSWV